MNNEVIINGVKYVPENYAGLILWDIQFDNFSQVLYNIQCVLTDRFVGALKEGEVPSQYALELRTQVHKFREFCKTYFGYEWNEEKLCFERIVGFTLQHCGIKPKFKKGDVMRTIEEKEKGIQHGLPFVEDIDALYYICNNEKIPIIKQEEYEFPPFVHQSN